MSCCCVEASLGGWAGEKRMFWGFEIFFVCMRVGPGTLNRSTACTDEEEGCFFSTECGCRVACEDER